MDREIMEFISRQIVLLECAKTLDEAELASKKIETMLMIASCIEHAESSRRQEQFIRDLYGKGFE